MDKSEYQFYLNIYKTNEFADKDTLIRCLLSALKHSEITVEQLRARLNNSTEKPWYCTGQPVPGSEDGWQ